MNISEEEIEELPEVGCSNILADDIRLGKTLIGYKDKNCVWPMLIVAPLQLMVIGKWARSSNTAPRPLFAIVQRLALVISRSKLELTFSRLDPCVECVNRKTSIFALRIVGRRA